MDKLEKSVVEIALGSAIVIGGLMTEMAYSNDKNSQSEAREMYRLVNPILNDQADNYLGNINPKSGYLISVGGLILTATGIKKLFESD